MREEQREHVLNMLFGSMLGQLDELKESGVAVPSEVYLYLGMLQGNMSGILNVIVSNHDNEIARLKRKLSKTDPDDEPEEELEEVLDDLETHTRNVVRLRDDK